jgi:AAA+ superfamily predicted ATPase
MNISEIQEKIETGDIKRLMELTGYSERYIKYVITGARSNETIEEAITMLISHRELSNEIIKSALNRNEKDKSESFKTKGINKKSKSSVTHTQFPTA